MNAAELPAAFSRPGRHLRGFHYVLVSQRTPILFRDGTRYLNTEACWDKLQAASTSARYLKLVSPEDIVDHRNPPPHLHAAVRDWASDPRWDLPDPTWRLPSIPT